MAVYAENTTITKNPQNSVAIFPGVWIGAFTGPPLTNPLMERKSDWATPATCFRQPRNWLGASKSVRLIDPSKRYWSIDNRTAAASSIHHKSLEKGWKIRKRSVPAQPVLYTCM